MEIDQTELLKVITSFLTKFEIPYMITGAWSVIYYGRPRASHDIDFVVELTSKDATRILKALKTLSTEFSYQQSSVENALEKKGMFQILYLPTYLKLDFWILRHEPFDETRFNRRKKIPLLGQKMVIASPEDTILQKLRWYKEARIEKHIVDAAFVYQIQKKNLDKNYLSRWAKLLSINLFLRQLDKIDLDKFI